jgi:hypothetical protein
MVVDLSDMDRIRLQRVNSGSSGSLRRFVLVVALAVNQKHLRVPRCGVKVNDLNRVSEYAASGLCESRLCRFSIQQVRLRPISNRAPYFCVGHHHGSPSDDEPPQ